MNDEKRAELHLHTKFSDNVSVISVEDALQKAKEYGLSAMALVNLNGVQDFPRMYAAAKKLDSDLKIIYGAEVLCKSDVGSYGLVLLVKNQNGLKSLYKIISSIDYNDSKLSVKLDTVLENRENLLIGMLSVNNNLLPYERRFYDYVEISPYEKPSCVERTLKICKEYNIPALAACNANCLSIKDHMARDIVYEYTKRDYCDSHTLEKTDDLLEHFSYLGKEVAHKLVIENPNMIADMVERIEPFYKGYCGEAISGAYKKLSKKCYERAREIYGNELAPFVEGRLKSELAVIKKSKCASQFLVAGEIIKAVREGGYLSSTQREIASSFCGFLLGISEINPLPVHYYCDEHHFIKLSEKEPNPIDAPEEKCPICSKPLKRDGFNIPFEATTGISGEMLPEIALKVSPNAYTLAIKTVAGLLGRQRVSLAGRVHKITMRSAQFFIEGFLDGGDICEDVKNDLCSRIVGTKDYDDVNYNGIVAVPDGVEFEEFTPISGAWGPLDYVTHIDGSALLNSLFRIDIIPEPLLLKLEELQKATGDKVSGIEAATEEVIALFANGDTEQIEKFELDFSKNVLLETSAQRFFDIAKVCGFMYATNAWYGTGGKLIECGIKLKNIPTTRDDVFYDLLEAGAHREFAYRCSQMCGKGRLLEDEQLKSEFKKYADSISDWYYSYASKIKYMSSKASVLEIVFLALKFAYYKAKYPRQFKEIASK